MIMCYVNLINTLPRAVIPLLCMAQVGYFTCVEFYLNGLWS